MIITPNISNPTSITMKLIIEIIKTDVYLLIDSTYNELVSANNANPVIDIKIK